MNLAWTWAALTGLLAFLACLVGAAWLGQTPEGRWRPGAWRWLAAAALAAMVMWLGLHRAGIPPTGLHYPAEQAWSG